MASLGLTRNYQPRTYIRPMPKPIELPSAVARAFARDMRAYHSEKSAIKADGIAARQLHALKEHYSGKLKLHDVKAMFHALKDHE